MLLVEWLYCVIFLIYVSDKFHLYCIIGDFNLIELYDIINANLPCLAVYDKLFDCMLSCSPIQYENRIDLIFYSQFLDIGLTEVDVSFSMSNHCSKTSHILLDERGNLPNTYFLRKNFMKADYNAFNDFLMCQNWNEIFLHFDSVNEMRNKSYNVINDRFDKFVPICVNTVKKYKKVSSLNKK